MYLDCLSLSCLMCDCLLCIDPCSFLTMSLNKTLQMDPHVSCSDHFVTEYSATQGSSRFSNENLANGSELPDCMLIDFFCDGLNQPLKSKVIHKGPCSSLSNFRDYVLWTVGSAFTVGVTEERNTTLTSMIAAALEHTHKMAATAEPIHKMATTTTPRHIIAASHESIQVTVDVKEPSQVTVDVKEPSQVAADLKELSRS